MESPARAGSRPRTYAHGARGSPGLLRVCGRDQQHLGLLGSRASWETDELASVAPASLAEKPLLCGKRKAPGPLGVLPWGPAPAGGKHAPKVMPTGGHLGRGQRSGLVPQSRL